MHLADNLGPMSAAIATTIMWRDTPALDRHMAEMLAREVFGVGGVENALRIEG